MPWKASNVVNERTKFAIEFEKRWRAWSFAVSRRLQKSAATSVEGLALDDKPVARHHARLPPEWQVIEILRDRHLDREIQRVAAAGDQRHRTERGLHVRLAAAAAVLLPPMLHVAMEFDVCCHCLSAHE